MDKKWVMIRVPESLKNELQGYALSLADQLEPKQQGNHEDIRSWDPPLWRVIGLLLARDKDHRVRSRRNSVPKSKPARFTTEGGIADDHGQPDANQERGVYTDPT